jgi:hypothetical protein
MRLGWVRVAGGEGMKRIDVVQQGDWLQDSFEVRCVVLCSGLASGLCEVSSVFHITFCVVAG